MHTTARYGCPVPPYTAPAASLHLPAGLPAPYAHTVQPADLFCGPSSSILAALPRLVSLVMSVAWKRCAGAAAAAVALLRYSSSSWLSRSVLGEGCMKPSGACSERGSMPAALVLLLDRPVPGVSASCRCRWGMAGWARGGGALLCCGLSGCVQEQHSQRAGGVVAGAQGAQVGCCGCSGSSTGGGGSSMLCQEELQGWMCGLGMQPGAQDAVGRTW